MWKFVAQNDILIFDILWMDFSWGDKIKYMTDLFTAL